MKKRTIRIKILVIWGFILALLNTFVGITGKSNGVFLGIGLISLFLSFGIFMLWNWVRIMAIVFSLIFIGLYSLLIIAAINKAYQGFAGIACFFHAPLFLLSVFCLNVLFHKADKILFKNNEQGTLHK